jgi:hypothetical protein
MDNVKKSARNNNSYQSKMTRRDSLKWFAILSASAVLPLVNGCDFLNYSAKIEQGHWPNLNLSPITVKGYGKDPNLIFPPKSPWPKTLTTEQLSLVAVLADILVPRDGNVPSATEVKVPDVIDEWVSAPYQRQQADRLTFLSMLVWIDDESLLRFSKAFVAISSAQKLEIIDDIAYQKSSLLPEFQRITDAFASFRQLVLSAFFCSPEGTKDLGYLGNVPIMGDYPGPTKEAMQHLIKKLAELGLKL